MIPNLSGKTNNEKMSSSEVNSKIDLLDTPKNIRKKINKAFLEQMKTDAPLFQFIKYVIFGILELQNYIFIINREEKYGGILQYNDYESLISDYQMNKVTPPDIKLGVSDFLITFLEPLRNKFNDNNIEELVKLAYP
jgi:tyrosyl-tRNA synthetase